MASALKNSGCSAMLPQRPPARGQNLDIFVARVIDGLLGRGVTFGSGTIIF